MNIKACAKRIACGLEYSGTDYYGWQHQAILGKPTIQGVLTKALICVGLDMDHRGVAAAGRTDRGVHAREQVVHFDTSLSIPNRSWPLAVNRYLPSDIAITWAMEVPSSFHARFAATSREYRYIILHGAGRKKGLWFGKVLYYPGFLNVDLIESGLRHLIGEQDFTSFRSSECQSHTPFRNVSFVSAVELSPGLLEIRIVANAFLHHMVRNIVGTVIEVGSGRRDPSWVREILYARDRRLAGPTAPSKGLYLHSVSYPKFFNLPSTEHTEELRGASCLFK